ncbi:DegT/DnrJ/EryC1/StrS family aminotransferase [Pseudomonas syringae]|uniref:DegT/DnrJ/EryC1/StrS family aminotransferase n=3 Tax=Pseudomonas syringae TaxID=317 RepID=UPI001F3D9A4A|nr:DegT/DnrJ/EryC1/StrS family aminotransferase [Pseudomonas syringae]
MSADHIGGKCCVGTNSGTDALILALLAMGIGPGDEVITQANTFYATVAAICFVGATPVLVDAEPHAYLMDVEQVEPAITARTEAIIAVHLFGKCMPMTKLLALAEKHQLRVIEDAAQSHGARIDGRAAGHFGDIGCFSFHPSKNLAAAGDAGAIVTDSTTSTSKDVHGRLFLWLKFSKYGRFRTIGGFRSSDFQAVWYPRWYPELPSATFRIPKRCWR